MRVRFHDETRAEIIEAVEFYDRDSTTAGPAFEAELERMVGEIERYPLLGSPVLRRARRRVLQGFPYYVMYQIRSDHIFIFAVSHFKQQWGYWLHRMERD